MITCHPSTLIAALYFSTLHYKCYQKYKKHFVSQKQSNLSDICLSGQQQKQEQNKSVREKSKYLTFNHRGFRNLVSLNAISREDKRLEASVPITTVIRKRAVSFLYSVILYILNLLHNYIQRWTLPKFSIQEKLHRI